MLVFLSHLSFEDVIIDGTTRVGFDFEEEGERCPAMCERTTSTAHAKTGGS